MFTYALERQFKKPESQREKRKDLLAHCEDNSLDSAAFELFRDTQSGGRSGPSYRSPAVLASFFSGSRAAILSLPLIAQIGQLPFSIRRLSCSWGKGHLPELAVIQRRSSDPRGKEPMRTAPGPALAGPGRPRGALRASRIADSQ
jgi:hypothetical protein